MRSESEINEEIASLQKAINKASSLTELAESLQDIVIDIVSYVEEKGTEADIDEVDDDLEWWQQEKVRWCRVEIENGYGAFLNGTQQMENFLNRALGKKERELKEVKSNDADEEKGS